MLFRSANMVSNITVNLLYGVRLSDINTCFKVFKREALSKITIDSSNFAFESEITVKLLKKGFCIKEIPIDYVARTKESGKKMNWRKALEMYYALFQYKFCKQK